MDDLQHLNLSRLPGLNMETDQFEVSNGDWMFDTNRQAVKLTRLLPDLPSGTQRKTRNKLTLICSPRTLMHPEPFEFVWRPLRLLGQIDAWESLIRPFNMSFQADQVQCHWQTADYGGRQQIIGDVVRDQEAWRAVRRHMLNEFLIRMQNDYDRMAAGDETEISREDPPE